MTQRALFVICLIASPLVSAVAGAEPQPAPPPAVTAAAAAPSDAKQAATDGAKKGPGEKAAREMRAQLEVPLFSDRFASVPVATVDDEVITLQQLMDALSLSHQGRRDGDAKAHDYAPVLERLITLKLCVAEAREMGLDELPEFKESVRVYEEKLLRAQLVERATKDVRANALDVERFFKDSVREWKIQSLLFAKQEDATKFADAVKAGQPFEAAGNQALAEKKASGSLEPEFVPAQRMQPSLAQAIAAAPLATTIGPSKVAEGWTVLQAIEVRYPEDAAARAKAEEGSLEIERDRAEKVFHQSLLKKNARVDRKLLGAVDFEAPKPGFAALLKDKRTLVRISGGEAVTVGDLAAGIAKKFYHGVDEPAKQRRINSVKPEVLETVLRDRLLLTEALRTGGRSRPEYQRNVEAYRDATLFGAVLDRAIIPTVKASEKDEQDYFAAHKGEFTHPAMYKLESLAFAKAKDAQATLEKLKAGTDFTWLQANADGQIKDEQRAAQIDGVISSTGLTPDLAKQLTNAKTGDYRLYDLSDQHYVIRVVQMTPPKEQTFEQVRATIAKRVKGEAVNKAVKEWGEKLRAAHEVTVYLTKFAN